MPVNNNIFIILIILIILTKITKENNELKKDRIIWTLKEIFNSFETSIIDEDYPLSLYYIKYKIQFSDFKISNPIEKELNIYENEPYFNYSVKNISFYINYKNYIFFDEKNNNLKYEDLENKMEITFKEIVFYEDSNFLYVFNSIVDSIILPKIKKISHLRFFKDYNEGKVKPFFPDENEYCTIEEALSSYLNNVFLRRINDILNNINLYLFDFYQIMDMTKNISYKDTELTYLQDIDYIYISEYIVPKDYVYVNFYKLYINYLELSGNFTFNNGDFVEFKAYLKIDNYISLDAKLGIDFYNPRHFFEFKLLDPEIDNNTLFQYEYVFYRKYRYILEENSLIYFKNLSN